MRFFFKKVSKWPVTPTFFSKNVLSLTRSSGRVKKSGCLCSKYLTSLLRHLYICKQAGLDLNSARRDFDPRTIVSGNLRQFDTTVRCAAHYAGATLTPRSVTQVTLRREFSSQAHSSQRTALTQCFPWYWFCERAGERERESESEREGERERERERERELERDEVSEWVSEREWPRAPLALRVSTLRQCTHV